MHYKYRSELPLKLLERTADSEILVKLKDGSEYKGILTRSDPLMNIILSDARQVNEKNEPIANYGVILIRGSNILYIAIEPDNVSYE